MGAPHLRIEGQRFGRLIAVCRTEKDKHYKWKWLFQCDCGKTLETIGASVVKGDTQSCGCLHRERASEANKKHGFSNHEIYLYSTWKGLRGRCNNPNHQDYPNYGGRGITVCARWDDFINFVCDVGLRPSAAHTLDRINNDGNYEPTNVRWATKATQNQNKSRDNETEPDNIQLAIEALGQQYENE